MQGHNFSLLTVYLQELTFLLGLLSPNLDGGDGAPGTSKAALGYSSLILSYKVSELYYTARVLL